MIEKETQKLENDSSQNTNEGKSSPGEIIEFPESERGPVSNEKQEANASDTESEQKPETFDDLEGEFAETDPEHTIEKGQGQGTGEQQEDQEDDETNNTGEPPVIDFAIGRKKLSNIDLTKASNAGASQDIVDNDIRRQAA